MNGAEIPEGVEIEQVWAIEAEFAPDGEARRRPVRHAHLAKLAQLMREGVVVVAGRGGPCRVSVHRGSGGRRGCRP